MVLGSIGAGASRIFCSHVSRHLAMQPEDQDSEFGDVLRDISSL